MPRTHSFAGYKMEDMVMGNACTWNEFCICDSRRWPLRTLVLDASWHYDNFYVCKLYGFTLGASELDDAWPCKNYLLSYAKDFWKLVSSSVDVSIGLSLAAISTQSIAAISGQVWLFSKKIGVSYQPSHDDFWQEVQQCPWGCIYHIMFLMHLWLSLLLILRFILLTESRPIRDLMFTKRNLWWWTKVNIS